MPESLIDHEMVTKITDEADWNDILFLPDRDLVHNNPYIEREDTKCPDRFMSPTLVHDFDEWRRLSSEFSRLALWSLDHVDKIVYLAVDTLIHSNIDELFDCPTLLCAAEDPKREGHFDSSIMVLQTNELFHQSLLLELDMCHLPSHDFGVTGFLNSIFRCYNTNQYGRSLYTKQTCPHCIGEPLCTSVNNNIANQGTSSGLTVFNRVDGFDSLMTFSVANNGTLLHHLESNENIKTIGLTHFEDDERPWKWYLLPFNVHHWDWIGVHASMDAPSKNFLLFVLSGSVSYGFSYGLIWLLLPFISHKQREIFENRHIGESRITVIARSLLKSTFTLFLFFLLVNSLVGAGLFGILVYALNDQTSHFIAWPLFHGLHSSLSTLVYALLTRGHFDVAAVALKFQAFVLFSSTLILWTPTIMVYLFNTSEWIVVLELKALQFFLYALFRRLQPAPTSSPAL